VSRFGIEERMKHRNTVGAFSLAAALSLGLLASAPATLAQISPSNNGPIDITADNGDFSNQTCESTWSGSAEALQGDSRLRADVIRAVLKKKPQAPGAKPPAGASLDAQSGCGPTDHIEADGRVFYVTPTQEASSDRAVYTADDNTIVMTGHVIVVQGENVVRGDRMIINTQTRVVHMFSDATGRGTPGRVRGVFFPNQNGSNGPAIFAAPTAGAH
jgi:lipopolysaccharide export system protein LptA